MSDTVVILLQIGIPVFLILLGYSVGKYREHRHLNSIVQREQHYRSITVTNLKRPPADAAVAGSFLCQGSVVIASDYFKSFGAALKTLLGGRLQTLETLLERGRREAVLRMLWEADRGGAHMVLNVRLETSAIMRGGGQKHNVGGVEVLAYGTAVTTG